jgi:translation initiation factor IF-2
LAKASTRKLYELAKELGIKSKVIIDKCQENGLDVKTHMATISAGLEATIRNWFAEAADKAAEAKSQKAQETPAAEGAEEAPQASGEKEAAAPKEEKEEESPEKQTAEPEAQKDESQDKPEEQKPAEKAPKAPEKVKPEPIAAKEPVMHEPPKPDFVKPAGPQLNMPAPAKLSGPRVVRVEEPEPVSTRPPKKKRPKKDRVPFSKPPVIAPVDVVPAKADTRKSKKRKDTPDDDFGKGRIARSGGKHKVKNTDIEERKARLAAARGSDLRHKPARKIEVSRKGQQGGAKKQPVKHETPEKAVVSEPITVKDLAAALTVKINDVILKLMQQGVMATANQAIATDVAELIALDFGTELEVKAKKRMEEEIEEQFEQREHKKLKKRPAVVTMLGHVDHGKTSLLDKIRSASVATGEAGGITQHIGAYQAELNGKKVTFLDTPGHAAFTAMRARGANMTDIVVLVIAADDGVMPQTAEAIRHAQAADVTIVVALNKIDLPGIDENKVYGQLAEYQLVPVEWGGDTEVIKTSAQTGQGIAELIEHIDLIAELNEYQADSTIPATGWVVEAKMTTTQGVVATLLLKEGRLRKGDVVFAGTGFGKVRTMKNSFGKVLKEATSSMPVEVTGLSEVPQAGDKFYVLDDLNLAKSAADENKALMREEKLAKRSQVTLDNLFTHIEAGNIKELNLIIRADVQGSVDVLVKHLTDLSTEEVKVSVIHAAVGGITEGDVVLAEASSAIIIGFNVVPESQVKQLAESKGVDIRLYSIIYRITEDLKDAMAGMLEPEEKENSLGKLVVRDTFKVPGIGTVAGCYVTEGIIKRNAKLRLIRNNIIIKDDLQTESLKHFKDDVKEVRAGFECGVKIAKYDDVKVEDVMEAYEIVKVARTL